MNPYVVVGSPNYAAPLLNFSPLSGKQQQPQQGQQKNGQQQQNPYQAMGSSIANFGRGLYNYLNPQAPAGMPMNISPGSVAGTNAMLAGIY